MNQKRRLKIIMNCHAGTGLRYGDGKQWLVSWERDGFDFIVYAPDARYPYMMVPYGGKKR